MSIPLAHAGHWYTTVLYIAPVVIVAVALWWSGRRGGPSEPDEESPDDL